MKGFSPGGTSPRAAKALASIAIAVLVAPALAAAGTSAPTEPFEVIERGDVLEVVAHDMKAARTAVLPVRSRLEVELAAGTPYVRAQRGKGEIYAIELEGGSRRRLSVKLVHERADVKTIARFAQAIQVGEDLHLLFPRTAPGEGVVIAMPEPTLPPELAAKLAAAKQPGPAITAAKPEPPTAAPSTGTPTEAPPATPASASTPPAEPAPIAGATDSSSGFSMYGMLAIGLIGLGVWLVKRKRAAPAPASTIEVIAQRALGSKAKIVWFTAAGREMVVSVTPQQVRMLGHWKQSAPVVEAPTSRTSQRLPVVQALPDAATAQGPRYPRASSVSGILKLRNGLANTGSDRARVALGTELDDDVATGDLDADALWAKEILAATGGRR